MAPPPGYFPPPNPNYILPSFQQQQPFVGRPQYPGQPTLFGPQMQMPSLMGMQQPMMPSMMGMQQPMMPSMMGMQQPMMPQMMGMQQPFMPSMMAMQQSAMGPQNSFDLTPLLSGLFGGGNRSRDYDLDYDRPSRRYYDDGLDRTCSDCTTRASSANRIVLPSRKETVTTYVVRDDRTEAVAAAPATTQPPPKYRVASASLHAEEPGGRQDRVASNDDGDVSRFVTPAPARDPQPDARRVVTTQQTRKPTPGTRVAQTQSPARTQSQGQSRRGVGPRESEQLPPKEITRIRAANGAERSAQKAPVWNPFIKALKVCAPGCEPIQYSAYRGHGKTCHRTGTALDVFGIKCGGRTYMAINGGKYAEMVKCMKGKMKKVLYRNGRDITLGHHNHAHFSIGCYGGTYW